jgi:hypothetical protein
MTNARAQSPRKNNGNRLVGRDIHESTAVVKVAQIFNLSVSPEIVARREDLTQRRRGPQTDAETKFTLRFSAFLCVSALVGWVAIWLRLGRAALYRRIAFCEPCDSSTRHPDWGGLPVKNRRYSRLKICATLSLVLFTRECI